MFNQSVNNDYEITYWTPCQCKEQSPLYKEQEKTLKIRGKEIISPQC